MSNVLQLYSDGQSGEGQGVCLKAGQRFVPANPSYELRRSPTSGYAPRLHFRPTSRTKTAANTSVETNPLNTDYLFDVQTFTAPVDGILSFRADSITLPTTTIELPYVTYFAGINAARDEKPLLTCRPRIGTTITPPIGLAYYYAAQPTPLINVNEGGGVYLWAPIPYQNVHPSVASLISFTWITDGYLIFVMRL